jgi:hypothetical protein
MLKEPLRRLRVGEFQRTQQQARRVKFVDQSAAEMVAAAARSAATKRSVCASG